MSRTSYRYIYGPVYSWRLGRSLGVDPLSGRVKACTFDCIYCQLGRRKPGAGKRRVFVKVGDLIRELRSVSDRKIDYITFSGTGEPTLAKNLGGMITSVKKLTGHKVAVLTNGSLIHRKDVQKDLARADLVMVKLDAPAEPVLKKVNNPEESVSFQGIVQGIRSFRRFYKGILALQIMFVQGNKIYAQDIAEIARTLRPDITYINTPLRDSRAKPLNRREIDTLCRCFQGLNAVSVYDAKKMRVKPINKAETSRRRKIIEKG